MEENIQVSVIMPVHNGEKYLRDTLDCVVNQTLKNIEIICVNDGSDDGSIQILEEYSRKDSRILVVNQEKSNAGVARNQGLKQAKGKYLVFWDSDDLFETNALEVMFNQCEHDGADLCVCNANQYYTDTGAYLDRPYYLKEKFLPEQIPFSRKIIGPYILNFTTSVPWNKMVKAEFIKEKEICFQDIERANDQYFSILSITLAERITVVRDILVHYRVRQDGNLTKDFSSTPMCAFYALKASYDKLMELGVLQEEDLRRSFANKALNSLIYSLNIQNDVAAYKQLYEYLTQGGFENVGICDCGKDYYFSPAEYENYKKMMAHTYTEFLLLKNKEYRDSIVEKNQKNKELVQENKELKKDRKELNSIKSRKWYKIITKMLDILDRIKGKK